MTASLASNLSGSRIQQLLRAVGSVSMPAESVPEVTVHDWRDPHYFNEDQNNRLAAVMTQVAALLSDRFAHFYQSEFDVKVASITQHFADWLLNQAELDQGFSLSFGAEPGTPSGFLAVATQTALGWATRLLGDAQVGEDSERSISSLEESLLTDLLTAVTQAFLGALGEPQSLRPLDQLTKGAPIMPCDPTTELCRLVFLVTESDAEADANAQIQFILPAHTLAPLVGKTIAAPVKMTREQLTRLLTEHVYDVPVTVTARLAATQISFEDVLDLATDDVLLTNKPIHEPVDLIVADRVLFRGSPAQSEARYAVLVTECTAGPVPAAATPPAVD